MIQDSAASESAASRQVWTRRRVLQLAAAAVGVVISVMVLTLLINSVGVPRLQALIVAAGPLAPLAYIAIKIVTYVFAPLTSGPIQVFAGTLFGNVWLGVLYTVIGETIGGSISFWIARRYGRPVVARFVGSGNMSQVDDFYRHRLGGWLPLAVARLVLFSFWDFLSYAAGLAPVKFSTYLFVSVVFGTIPTLLFVWLGERFVGDSSLMVLSYGLLAVLTVGPLLLLRPISQLLAALSRPR